MSETERERILSITCEAERLRLFLNKAVHHGLL